MTQLKTKLAGVDFDNCLMNASGVHCQTVEELDGLLSTVAGTLVTKSATVDYRAGNPSPRYQDLDLGSINSMGLPNEGFQYYLDYVLEKQKTVKNLFLSIAGLTYQENIDMLKQVQASDFSGLTELNLSCPNVPGKPQTAYDFEATDAILSAVFKFFTKPLGVKLPPYFDLAHFDAMANILNQYDLQFVTCVNSIGNGLFINPENESVVIKPKNGFGGIGGDYIKPTALANVRAFYTRLKPSINVIGCGGVKTGMDVFEHILCGASLVQVGTALHKEGPSIFDRLTNELKTVMENKGYKDIESFKGKLKSI